jgi:L-Ala-D/L-Glu epimerase
MQLFAQKEFWPARKPFRIANRRFDTFDSVTVTLSEDGETGVGEALGVFYLDDDQNQMLSEIEAVRGRVESGITRLELLDVLPPGGARNAIDLALWDLECKKSGERIWSLTNTPSQPIQTVYTISIEDSPEDMGRCATEASEYSLFKVKLDSDQPVERIAAIRQAAPSARIVVDANQGWSFAQLVEVAPEMAGLGVEMIEQPLPRGEDDILEGFDCPIPLCADESCLHLGELAQARDRYQMVNIKLDKTGGLTHAFQLLESAREAGMGVMVGCMGGSSLAMAPAYVLGCHCDLVDIDGPLLLAKDRVPGIEYSDGYALPFSSEIWG